MAYKIEFHELALSEDLVRLDSSVQKRIIRDIKAKLLVSPFEYGRPLRSPLGPSYKLRVGNYRVLYRVQGKIVRIGRIGHRATVYQQNPAFRDF